MGPVASTRSMLLLSSTMVPENSFSATGERMSRRMSTVLVSRFTTATPPVLLLKVVTPVCIYRRVVNRLRKVQPLADLVLLVSLGR